MILEGMNYQISDSRHECCRRRIDSGGLCDCGRYHHYRRGWDDIMGLSARDGLTQDLVLTLTYLLPPYHSHSSYPL